MQASSFYQLSALNAELISLFFSFSYRNLFLLTILKGLKPFWLQVKTWNWIKELLALEFCRNQNKVISILTETHINHDQIHQIRNNWLGSNFFSLGILTQKDACPASFGTWRLTLIQKGGLCPLILLPLMTEFFLCVYASQDIAPGKSWTGGVSSKDYNIRW